MSEQKRLKILVFDDTGEHRESAKLLLGTDHDLTVVGTYDEAQELLLPKYDDGFALDLFAERYGDRAPYKRDGMSEGEHDERWNFYTGPVRAEATTYPKFDAVLTDLFVPASAQAQGGVGEQFVGQRMPLGTNIALLALCAGVKMVAVVTNENHHHHPASAAFDCFKKYPPKGDVRILCTNHVEGTPIDEETGEAIDLFFLVSPMGVAKYPYQRGGAPGSRDGVRWGGKNWKKVLQELTGEVEIEEP